MLLFSFQLFGADQFRIWKDGKFRSIDIYSKDNTQFGKKCSQNPKSCLAFKAYKIKPINVTKDNELAGHPASDHCEAIGGKVYILEDNKRAQYNFCEFSDGSMIDSWSLYNQFKGKKK